MRIIFTVRKEYLKNIKVNDPEKYCMYSFSNTRMKYYHEFGSVSAGEKTLRSYFPNSIFRAEHK